MKIEASSAKQLIFEPGTGLDLQRVLRSAVQMAKIMNLRLEAIFQPDEQVVRAAALPVVREVSLWTAQERQTSSRMLSRSMRIRARLAGNMLAQIAEREQVAYTLVFDHNSADEQDGATSIYWVGGRGLSSCRAHYPVCVFDSGDEAGQACVREARCFAAATGRSLKRYRLPESGQEGGDAVRAWLQRAAKLPCSALFLPKSFYPGSRLADRLRSAPFPVLLV